MKVRNEVLVQGSDEAGVGRKKKEKDFWNNYWVDKDICPYGHESGPEGLKLVSFSIKHSAIHYPLSISIRSVSRLHLHRSTSTF